MNHYPMITTLKGTKTRCGQWVDRAAHANPSLPFTCPDCEMALSTKAAAERKAAISLPACQERDFHMGNANMFRAYASE